MARGRAAKPKEGVETWQRMLEEETRVVELIDQHHKHLKQAHAVVLVLGRPKAQGKNGHVKLATLRLAKRSEQVLFAVGQSGTAGKVHYIVTVGLDRWRGMDWKEKEHVLDHELCHAAGINEKGRWGTREHDVEEFVEILQRHGPRDGAQRDFVKVARQLDLELV